MSTARSQREREHEEASGEREPNALARWLRRRSASSPGPTPDPDGHVRIPAAEFAARHGFRETAIVSRIQKGIYDGGEVDGEWYVIRRPELDGALAGLEQRQRSAERRLPWRTAPPPLSEVGPILLGVLVVAAVATGYGFFGTSQAGHLVWLLAFGAYTATPLVLLVAALRTGVALWVAGRPVAAFATQPLAFAAVCTGLALLVGLGWFVSAAFMVNHYMQ